MSSPSPGANLFGSSGFWAFAIIISIIWGVTTCTSTENKKAEADKSLARARSLSTESGAVTKCESWMRELYSQDRPFRIVTTRITADGDLYYYMDVTYEATSPIDRKTYTNTEHCNVQWDRTNDSWEIRAR